MRRPRGKYCVLRHTDLFHQIGFRQRFGPDDGVAAASPDTGRDAAALHRHGRMLASSNGFRWKEQVEIFSANLENVFY